LQPPGLEQPSDIDGALQSLMAEAYVIGVQQSTAQGNNPSSLRVVRFPLSCSSVSPSLCRDDISQCGSAEIETIAG
jgi:hypothetical protein